VSTFYVSYLNAPLLTGIKVFLGCFSFGLFGGMLCFLSTEKRIMECLKEVKADAGHSPKRLFSVSIKMLFFVITVLVFMFIAILLMVFMVNIHKNH